MLLGSRSFSRNSSDASFSRGYEFSLMLGFGLMDPEIVKWAD